MFKWYLTFQSSGEYATEAWKSVKASAIQFLPPNPHSPPILPTSTHTALSSPPPTWSLPSFSFSTMFWRSLAAVCPVSEHHATAWPRSRPKSLISASTAASVSSLQGASRAWAAVALTYGAAVLVVMRGLLTAD